jgi:hypothetical protein
MSSSPGTHMRRLFVLLAAGAIVCAATAHGQDEQSLGDAARQARFQKQQKDAKSKNLPANSNDAQPVKAPKRVVTNEDIPEHVGSTLTSASNSTNRNNPYTPRSYAPRKATAEEWRTMIQGEKAAITSMQAQMENLSHSIHYPIACLTNCVQRNERQKEKQNQVEILQGQLDQMQKQLEDLQEAARRQGLGSAIYDP